jgi:hypothetical protein
MPIVYGTTEIAKMTLQLSLPPDLEKRLKLAASKKGQQAEEYAVEVLEQNVPPAQPNFAAAQMLLSWANEIDAMTDEESSENEKILRAIDEDRLSDRKLFTHLLKGKSP